MSKEDFKHAVAAAVLAANLHLLGSLVQLDTQAITRQ